MRKCYQIFIQNRILTAGGNSFGLGKFLLLLWAAPLAEEELGARDAGGASEADSDGVRQIAAQLRESGHQNPIEGQVHHKEEQKRLLLQPGVKRGHKDNQDDRGAREGISQ